MQEAGCTVVGGHSVDDREPKYGFAVTGVAPPSDITTNSEARQGQKLILTKPIGTGIVATAAKHNSASDEIIAGAIAMMVTLNKGAATAARRVGARAVTDVTGFGLLGHLAEMTRGSNVSAEIEAAAVPILEGALTLAAAGEIAGGTRRNLAAVEPLVTFANTPDEMKWVLADAQTSGGLLIAVDDPLSDALVHALADEGVPSWVIGSIVNRTFEEGPSGRISVF
jgi:selenide,water dikinase